MDAVLTTFIRALRNADVRISTSETLDAFRAAHLVGYADRELLKNALALSLPKTADEKAAFEACFERFFSAHPQRSTDRAIANDTEAGSEAAGSSSGAGGEGNASGARDNPSTRSDTTATSGELASQVEPRTANASSSLGQLLLRGNRLEIGMAIAAAGGRVGVQKIEVFTQKGLYTRRVLDAMGLAELQSEIAALTRASEIEQRQLGHELEHRRDGLREDVRAYVERQFLLHADVTGRRLREELLRDVHLAALDQRSRHYVEDIIRRMAKRLVARYSRRRRVLKRGQLHVPRTLRRNMRYDDAIFDLRWKSTRVDRPKVFAICDVSGSVAEHAGFMLTFLYSLAEVLPRVRAFAFSSELGEVSQLFVAQPIELATALALKQYGGGATDYGQAFADFKRICLDEIDSRTTVILLGDARNNGGDMRLDALREIQNRCRSLIWLNPEPRSMWNTGDSEMRHVAPYCHHIAECSTLNHLQRFVSRLIESCR